MSKRKWKHKLKRNSQGLNLDETAWLEKDGLHVVMPDSLATPEMLKLMTKRYQEEIRKSPLWNELVKAFGETKAEELLKELCVKKV